MGGKVAHEKIGVDVGVVPPLRGHAAVVDGRIATGEQEGIQAVGRSVTVGQLAQAEREQVQHAHVAGERLRYLLHEAEVLRPREHETPGLLGLVDHPLQVREDLRAALHLVEDCAARVSQQKPTRVAQGELPGIRILVNKGGIYYSALVGQPPRRVPALLFVGARDLAFRTNTIVGLFAVNRRAGALWALVEEPDTAHAVGRSRDLGAMSFDDVLALRLSASGLEPVEATSGFIGDLTAHTFQPVADTAPPPVPTAWLPTERIARAWQAVVTKDER